MDTPRNDHLNHGAISSPSDTQSTPLKPSRGAAENVLMQAKLRNASQHKFASLPSQRIERGVVDNKPFLTAIFPNKRGEPDRVDLSFLLEAPNLVDLFSNSFLRWGTIKKTKSRQVQSDLLKHYWCRYLRESSLTLITQEMLDEQILSGFNTWAHGPVKKKEPQRGSGLHPNTIRKALSCLRTILEATPEGYGIAQRIPAGPRGAQRKQTPTPTLLETELQCVIHAADKEIFALLDRWTKGRELLVRGYQLLNNGGSLIPSPEYRIEAKSDDNLALSLAMLDSHYPGLMPSIDSLRKHNKLLADTVQYAFGLKMIRGYFYPTPRDLIPLALHLAVATNFNPDTVLGLCWSNIDRNIERLGTESVEFRINKTGKSDTADEAFNMDATDQDNQVDRQFKDETSLTKIIGDKPRANQQLVRLLDPRNSQVDEASLDLVLDLVRDMTTRIRPRVDSKYSDRLFLFMPQFRARHPRGFGDIKEKKGISVDITWQHGLRSFISDNDLPYFTLKTIRATLMNLVQITYPGDLRKGQEMGNHKNFIVTWNHYTSDMVRKLVREQTGAVLISRDRWLQTQGKIDPRKTAETADKGCATPGFGCFDPFDSPRPNQSQGHLCNAYGECPACPLVMLRPGIPDEVVYWSALERAIYRSHSSMTREMWTQRWAPILAALKELISLVPPEVLRASRRLHIELPTVG